MPGDCNQDTQLDISDGICLLDFRFLGGRPRLTCGSGTTTDPGSRALMDANGDVVLDLSDAIGLLSYLFLGGQPHALGTGCKAIAGCPLACR